MSDAKSEAKESTRSLTAAEAAKRVMRIVVKRDGDAERVSRVPLRANEVLAFRDYGSHVVVVTTDGQKFSSADA